MSRCERRALVVCGVAFLVAGVAPAQEPCVISQVTNAATGSSFEPSLDGESIAFVSNADLTGENPDGSSEVFLYDGSSLVQVTDSGPLRSMGTSLDDGTIAFGSDADLTGENPEGNFEIFLARCLPGPSVLDVPAPGSAGLVLLALGLLTAAWLALRASAG